MYKYLTLILISVILVACSPSVSAIQTPVVMTVAVIPTQTAYSTYTALPPIIITATLPPYTSTPEPT
jgi:uncharacterized protein YcfL